MEIEIKSHLLRRERTITPLAYSPREAAMVLGIGRSTLYGLISAGQLSVVKVGSRSLIPATELAAFLERGGMKTDEPDQPSALDE